MSLEFGRRGPPPATRSYSRPSWMYGRTGWAIGVIFAAILGIAGALFLKAAGWSIARHWEQGVGYPSLDTSMAQVHSSNSRIEAVHNGCKARSGSVQLPRALADELDMMEGVRQGELAVTRSAAYLDCVMTDQPSRFCSSRADVDHLVQAVRTHLELMGKVQEEWTMSQSPYRSGLTPLPQRRSFPSAQLDPRVATALRGLASQGYIRAEDFATGWFGSGVPRPVAAALAEVAVDKDACEGRPAR
jgi:hypothetical protein